MKPDIIPLIVGYNPRGGAFKFDKNGNLQRYTFVGRQRKNWKSLVRMKSKKLFLKDKCEFCKNKNGLTIHHIIPLNKAILLIEENCQTVCVGCHRRIEEKITAKKMKAVNKIREVLQMVNNSSLIS